MQEQTWTITYWYSTLEIINNTECDGHATLQPYPTVLFYHTMPFLWSQSCKDTHALSSKKKILRKQISPAVLVSESVLLGCTREHSVPLNFNEALLPSGGVAITWQSICQISCSCCRSSSIIDVIDIHNKMWLGWSGPRDIKKVSSIERN